MENLQQRMWNRANSFHWDSYIFYTSDADMMRDAAARIEGLEQALKWVKNNSHDESAHYAVARDALG